MIIYRSVLFISLLLTVLPMAFAELSIDTDSISQSILKGESKKISINVVNEGENASFVLELEGLEGVVSAQQYLLDLPPGEEKTIELQIDADNEPRVIQGSASLITNDSSVAIPIEIEILPADVSLQLSVVAAAQAEDVLTTTVNLSGSGVSQDVNVTFYAKDEKGDLSEIRQESLIVADELQMDLELDVSELNRGEFVLEVHAQSKYYQTIATDVFSVGQVQEQAPQEREEEEPKEEKSYFIDILLVLVVLILVSVLFYPEVSFKLRVKAINSQIDKKQHKLAAKRYHKLRKTFKGLTPRLRKKFYKDCESIHKRLSKH